MIYIENLTFEKQVLVLRYLCKSEELEIIMWLFPESKVRSICDINLTPRDTIEGEPVTIYNDGYVAYKTKRIKVTVDLLDKIQISKEQIFLNCDSLVLYRPNDKQWMASLIGNENIVMVNDDSLLQIITNQGFNATLQTPNWW